jgi:hypothetical protein
MVRKLPQIYHKILPVNGEKVQLIIIIIIILTVRSFYSFTSRNT